MRAELNPEHARGHLVVNVEAEEAVRLADPELGVVRDMLSILGENMFVLIGSWNREGRDPEAPETKLAGAIIDEAGNATICMPDDWLPKSYFTRVSIPPESIEGQWRLERYAEEGILLVVDRSLQDPHRYKFYNAIPPVPSAQEQGRVWQPNRKPIHTSE